MIPAIGFMVCALLVAKGFEFIHRSLCGGPEAKRFLPQFVAAIMFLFCIATAAYFGFELLLAASRGTDGLRGLR